MNWQDDDLRAAALRILVGGRIRRARGCAGLVDHLDDLGIITPTRRKGEFVLEADKTEDLRRYLSVRWPDFQVSADAFADDPGGISVAALRALRRVHLALPDGVIRLNRKSWSAWAGAHSKSGGAAVPEGVQLTVDDVLRMRVNTGLVLRMADGAFIDLSTQERALSETILPERALDEDWQLVGTMPTVIVTVENLGAFVDIVKPSHCLIIQCPGWNSGLATRFIACLPADVPWLHFGDLDPNGLRIALTISTPETPSTPSRKPTLWIPDASTALLQTHARPKDTPWETDSLPPDLLAHPSMQWLVDHQCWLEHEAIALLPEFSAELGKL